MLHGPGIEPGNLVVGQIRGDVGPGGELAGNLLDARERQPQALQPLPVRAEIPPRGGHNDGLLPQQRQIVGDIARGAAEPLR